MSSEQPATQKRPYRKRKRAAHEQETRRRITEAAVDLHGSVGPARTTISAVADRAGVQRATVYRHFPTEEDLFGACSSHWLGQHPLPDLESWGAIADHDRRLRTALAELYGWYARGEQMLERTTRDAALVPALRPAMEGTALWREEAVKTLLRGRPERGARRQRLRAAVGHALAFETWRSLVHQQGLTADEAVVLMTGLIDAAAE